MKHLFLLRPAVAARRSGLRDHARPVAPRGIWAAEAVAEHCAKKLRRVDLALCSSAIRARETLRIFERHLPPSCKIAFDDGLYRADTQTLLAALRDVADRHDGVLLLGHDPGLTALARALCGDSGKVRAQRRIAKGLKAGSLATIDLDIPAWRKLRPGAGRLRAVIRPKDLR